MDLLIHDLAAACERDAADRYDAYDRAARFDAHRREPMFRLRAGHVNGDADQRDVPARIDQVDAP